MGIRELRLTEQQLFKLTPRQYFALINCAREFNEASNAPKNKKRAQQSKPKIGFVDEIKW